MTDAQRVWVTQDAYEWLKDELLQLVRERAGDIREDGVPDISTVDRDESTSSRRLIGESGISGSGSCSRCCRIRSSARNRPMTGRRTGNGAHGLLRRR
jgi:hypothetical protein